MQKNWGGSEKNLSCKNLYQRLGAVHIGTRRGIDSQESGIKIVSHNMINMDNDI